MRKIASAFMLATLLLAGCGGGAAKETTTKESHETSGAVPTFNGDSG